jgi:hypothetical protein
LEVKLPRDFPGEPVPAEMTGVARFQATFLNVLEQVSQDQLHFVRDHLLASFLGCWNKLIAEV